MKRRAAPLQPPEIIYFCKFRPKWTWNYGYLACKIQNFLRQGGAAPLQPHTYTFWQKRDWNCAFMVRSKYTFSYEKKSCPLQPPDIIHFFKLRPKRAWNYAYLTCKIQTNFLRQAWGSTPLQPPLIVYTYKEGLPPCDHRKSYNSVLAQKGPEIMHIKLAKYQIFVGKGVLPPYNKSYSSVSLDKKSVKLCIFNLQNLAAPL